MATARRAYTAEYQFNLKPEAQPERVRRTRQRPQVHTPEPKYEQTTILTPANLRTLIIAVVMVGILLIGTVVVNAQTAKLQYNINQLKNQNAILETEVSMLEFKIEKETSVEKLEDVALDKLGMHYPTSNQSVHIATLTQGEDSLSDIIKTKAYE